MKSILTLIGLSIMWCTFARPDSIPSADDAKKYTLAECLALGVQQNYSILITKEKQQIAERNSSWGNAGFLPSASLSASATGRWQGGSQVFENSTRPDSSFTGTRTLNTNPSVNISWTLFEGFKAHATYQKLKQLQQQGELQTRISIENTLAEISATYYQIVRQQIRRRNLQQAVKLSKERLDIVEARYTLGSASKLDLQQAQVDYNADYTLLVKQQEQIYSSRILLNQLISLEQVDQFTHIADTDITLLPLGSKEEVWNQILEANSYLLTAQSNKHVSQSDLRIARSKNYPSLKLNGSYGYGATWYDHSNLKFNDNYGPSVGVTLGMSLFDGLNRQREQRNAKTQIQIAELGIASLEQDLRADLATMWRAYTNNVTIINLEETNVGTAREYMRIAMDRYMLGDLSGIQLREAQNSLLEAEERLSVAQFDAKLSEISILLLSGNIIQKLM